MTVAGWNRVGAAGVCRVSVPGKGTAATLEHFVLWEVAHFQTETCSFVFVCSAFFCVCTTWVVLCVQVTEICLNCRSLTSGSMNEKYFRIPASQNHVISDEVRSCSQHSAWVWAVHVLSPGHVAEGENPVISH